MGILSVLGSPRPAGTPVGSATSITTTQLPPEFRPFITDIFQKAKAQQEGLKYIPFAGPRIRDFGPLQQEAFTGLTDLARQGIGTLPDATSATFLTGAREAAARAGRPITVEDIQRLSSPFQQEVTDIAKREAQRDFDLQVAPKIAAEAAAAGSFGGSRAGLLESESLKNLQEQLSDIQTKGSAQAFTQAQKAFQDERAAAAGLSGFLERQMTGVPNQALKELAGLQTVGESKQLLDQKALDLAYQDFLEEREFPTRALQEYQASVRGFPYTPAAYQYTTQTAPTPSLGQTLLTAASQGAGLYGALGGFGFGGTQKAASGGQIRGGLSGMVESHQNNVPIQYRTVPIDLEEGEGEKKIYYSGLPYRDAIERQRILARRHPETLGQPEDVTDDTITAKIMDITTAARGPKGRWEFDPYAASKPGVENKVLYPADANLQNLMGIGKVAQVSETDKTSSASTRGKEQGPISSIRKMLQNAQSPQEAFEAYRESFEPYIKSVKEAQVSEVEADRLEGEAAKILKKKALAGIGKREELREADLLRLQDRMKARTAKYGTEKEKLEGFGEDIQRQGREALEAEEEAGERIQQMHRDERQSLKEQERFEIFAGFGSVGGITEEEAALGQAVPLQGMLTTLGRIASEVTKSIKQPLRNIKEKERKSYKAEVRDNLLSGKEYRRLERAATLEDRNSFKELSQFMNDYENDLTKFYTAERTLKELETTVPEERAKAEVEYVGIMSALEGREAARKNIIAKLTKQALEGATKAKKDQATFLINAYSKLPDLTPDALETADRTFMLTDAARTFGDMVSVNEKEGTLVLTQKGTEDPAFGKMFRKAKAEADRWMAENADDKNKAIYGAQQIYMAAARDYHGGPSVGPPPNAIKKFQDAVKNQPKNRDQHIEAFRTKYNLTKEQAESQL